MSDFFKNLFSNAWAYASNWKWYTWAFLAVFLVGLSCGGCACQRWNDWFGSGGPIGAFGWVDDPARVQRVMASMPQPLFSDAARHLMGTEDKDALLYLAADKLLGRPLPAHNQGNVGSCCGHGGSTTVELFQCVQATQGLAEYKPISAAAVYALGREQGGGLGGGDGAVVAECANAMVKFGVLSSEDANDDDTDPQVNAPLAKKWGRTGLPRELKEKAKQRTVKTFARCKSSEDCRVALSNGYPLYFGSNVGFEGRGGFRRDSDGFCSAGGSWAHSMCCGGYRKDKRGFLIFQSWGASTPPGPLVMGMPSQSFWIRWEDMDRICRTGEVFALSAFPGWPAQNVDFFVQAAPRKPWQPALASLVFSLSP